MRTARKSRRPDVEEDLGETFQDVWTLRTDESTKDQDEEANKEELNEDDHEQELDKMTSRSGPKMGYL